TFALAKTYGGLFGEYRLDWFFVKGLATDSRKPGGKYQFAPHFAWTLMELNSGPEESLSDHAPITVDLPLTEPPPLANSHRSEEHTSELQSRGHLVCRLLLEKKKTKN